MGQSLNLGQLPTNVSAGAGMVDAYFDLGPSYTIASAATQVLPVGIFFLMATANCKVQMATDGTGTVWTDFIAAGAGGVIVSDGFSVRLTSTSGSVTPILLQKM